VTHDNVKTKPWRHAIVSAARDALGGRPPLEDVALEVRVAFYLVRPPSAPRRVTEPIRSRDDLDKLQRSLLDALTAAGVWRDDGQVTRILAQKAFAGGVHDPKGPTGIPRAEIVVRPAPAPSSAHAPLLDHAGV